jgi:geranylgeranyl diphosphate synthase type II
VSPEEQLKAYAARVEARLEQLLPSVDTRPGELHAAMRYSCLAPGKRLRPALAMACADAVGGKAEQGLDAGCAVEMVHCFSLIHDDLPAIDNDDLRRGMPTCHVVYGEAVAILAGDGLFALAYETLSGMACSPLDAVFCFHALSAAVGSEGLVGGETLDILSEGQIVDENTLTMIHLRKTAALMRAACVMGARLGGATASQQSALSNFGYDLGLAFQVTDDILNETSTPEQLGKAAGSDRARGKATFPALMGLQASQAYAAQRVERALGYLGADSDSEILRYLAHYAIDRLN